jgi:hypothetical protein
MPTIFTCRLCDKEHPSDAVDAATQVPMLPKSITTERSPKKEWFFKCVEECVHKTA